MKMKIENNIATGRVVTSAHRANNPIQMAQVNTGNGYYNLLTNNSEGL